MYDVKVEPVVCDYGIFENGELKLILNNRKNAEKIVKILKLDNENINCNCTEKDCAACRQEFSQNI